MRAWRVNTTRQKYGAKPKFIDGIRFASTKEAQRYSELKLLVLANEITHLELQPRFDLWAAAPIKDGMRNIIFVGVYKADFKYRDQRNSGVTVIEDVKSSVTSTEAYRLRKRIAEACHGITIREV